ncbi:MAG TPA: Trm112 family protein [Geobacteraceae bacterium]|nr:Trm112 family protein [Geobacteraceae bacterium]
MALSKELLEILVCPQCKGELYLLSGDSGLICRACRLKYPIHDEIPIMLVEEAESISE